MATRIRQPRGDDWKRIARFLHNRGLEYTPSQLVVLYDMAGRQLVENVFRNFPATEIVFNDAAYIREINRRIKDGTA